MIRNSEIRQVFLNKDRPGESFLNQLSFFLILWSLNPQSLQYSWAIWALFMLLWLGLVIYLTRGDALLKLFSRSLWVILLFPAWNLGMALLGRGIFHDRQISIALTLLLPWYFILYGKKTAMSLIARLALLYLGVIALTTLLQFITEPNISRALAGIQRGVFLSSPLLANFHTVYESVPLLVILFWGVLQAKGGGQRWFWASSFGLQLLLVVFAGYDIARLSTLLALAAVLLYALYIRVFRSQDPLASLNPPPPRKRKQFLALAGAFLVYSLPALMVLFAKGAMDKIFLNLDLRIMTFWAKLVNRLRVYLESVILFQEYPILGISAEPQPGRFELGYHSDYFDTLAEYGLVGFTIFVLSAFFLYHLMARELPRGQRGIYLLALGIFQLIFLVNPVVDVSSAVMLFFILPGLLYSLAAGSDEPREEDPAVDEPREEDPAVDEVREEDPAVDEAREEDPAVDELTEDEPAAALCGDRKAAPSRWGADGNSRIHPPEAPGFR